jgi:protein-S-isoprenylcysteine O-methyltransferase Ste14
LPIRFVIYPDRTAEAAFVAVIFCWFAFAAIAVMGSRGAVRPDARRNMKSHLGFFLQSVAYAICYIFARPYFSQFIPMPKVAEEILAAFAIAIALASVWFCFSAARTLGKQWALVARVIEGHELVTQGPYSIVRNPIYLAMLGMLIASALTAARWQVLPFAIALLQIGTDVRVRSEEKLLREAFGAKFDDYARRVPAIFPRLIR